METQVPESFTRQLHARLAAPSMLAPSAVDRVLSLAFDAATEQGAGAYFGDAEGRPGNCYQAAIASALELPLDDVPHFATFASDWFAQSAPWFRQRGLIRSFYQGQALTDLVWPLYLIPGTDFWGERVSRIIGALGAGPSPRGPFRHVVVLDPNTGDMIHDPHPSGAGVTEVDEVELILALEGGNPS